MSNTYAKVIADSLSEQDIRLTSVEVRLHRWVLAELNTHRVLSKNSASSRARPVSVVRQDIQENPALPVVWASEQKGMQGGEELDEDARVKAERLWDLHRQRSLQVSHQLGELGVHKSLTNRLLEPHSMHTVILTGTAWGNFFDQRCSPLAQPEIRIAAEMIREAMEGSHPDRLVAGEWHAPYVGSDVYNFFDMSEPNYERLIAQVSAARCARVSYLTQDGKRDPEEDLKLYKRLTEAQPPHWSPLEHVATPCAENRQSGHFGTMSISHLPKVGNLLGWRSLRLQVESEQKLITYR